MKRQKKFKNLIKEVINLITKFFSPYGLRDPILEITQEIKRMGFKVSSMKLAMSIIAIGFSFMLKATNLMIEYRFILLGMILFMLYRGQNVANEAFWVFQNSEEKKFRQIFEDEIIFRGSNIISKTSNKVIKYDETNNLYKLMSNEATLNGINNYLQNLWRLKIQHKFDVFELINVIILLVGAILTNTSISQFVFIPLIIIFVIISFLSSAYIALYRESYYKNNKKYNNQQSVIVNDLLRVPIIVNADMEMRINKLKEAVTANNKNIARFYNKINLSRLFVTIMEALSQYGIIIFYLLAVDFNSINLATITEITATLAVIETALQQVRRLAETLNNHSERLTIMQKEEDDIRLILDVYHTECKKTSTSKIVDNIEIKPFTIRYLEESENDKPFKLTSRKQININNGEIVILYGPSGSGKSTFMKMLTERIRLEKSTTIPSTSRFLMYNETLRFGSLSIYEEIFCGLANPDLTKMQKILENLHLWCEIKSNCFDVWQWMQEKNFEVLSNGQKQRLILAKMLYWLNENIDVMVLDECTSGLDDKVESDSADAERILEYLVRYANSDKKRIVIISTHQNIDGFKEKLANEYKFRSLQFSKEGEENLVREI